MKKGKKDQKIRIGKSISVGDCTLLSELLASCNNASDAMINIDYGYGGDAELNLQWSELETDAEFEARLKEQAIQKARIAKNKKDAIKAKEAADKKLYLELKKKFEK